MSKHILPMAKNSRTNETVKYQDLSGRRFRPDEQLECRMMADRLAEQMTFRTGDQWQGFVKLYTV